MTQFNLSQIEVLELRALNAEIEAIRLQAEDAIRTKVDKRNKILYKWAEEYKIKDISKAIVDFENCTITTMEDDKIGREIDKCDSGTRMGASSCNDSGSSLISERFPGPKENDEGHIEQSHESLYNCFD